MRMKTKQREITSTRILIKIIESINKKTRSAAERPEPPERASYSNENFVREIQHRLLSKV
jgi:hypothetical protein